MCEVLKVSRSGYYKWRDRSKSARQERREELTQEARRVYIESHQLYGSPKVTKKLHHEGIKVSNISIVLLLA